MNKSASELGKLSKGIKKTLSEEERGRRRERMANARKKRWKQKNGV